MSICFSDPDVARKWVPLISMALFTLSDAKKSDTQSQLLTVNRPYTCWQVLLTLDYLQEKISKVQLMCHLPSDS